MPTDISIAIPKNVYGRIAPRSGIALHHGIDVGAGVIDSDYRGNIQVLLFNHSDEEYMIKEGEKIAQIIFQSIIQPELVEVKSLGNTERGESCFGSSGK